MLHLSHSLHYISRQARSLAILALALMLAAPACAQWHNYLSYDSPTEIEQTSDGTLYVLASQALYSYSSSDGQLTT